MKKLITIVFTLTLLYSYNCKEHSSSNVGNENKTNISSDQLL